MWKKMSETWKATLLGVLVGVLLTIFSVFFSFYLFWQGGIQLEQEAADLRKHSNMMLTGMEKMGWIELARDHKGNVLGFKPVEGTLNLTAPKATMSVEGIVIHPSENKENKTAQRNNSGKNKP